MASRSVRRAAAVGCCLWLVMVGATARRARAQDAATPGVEPDAQHAEPARAAPASPLPSPEMSRAPASPNASAEKSSAPASPPPSLTWNPNWPRFRPLGYVVTGAAVAGAIAMNFLVSFPEQPRWTGGILFDDAIRNAWRAREPGARDAVRLASDITVITGVVHQAIVDSIIIPLSDHSPEVAWQLSLMNAQAYALNLLISSVFLKLTVARARPNYEQCRANPDFDPLCKTDTYSSFPSSHASTAFTAAGLTCVNHKYLPIYGGGPWDTGACIGSLTLATMTGLFRIIGDRHWTTDVIAGAAFGFSLGYLYPWLLHYRGGADKPSSAGEGTLHWGLIPGAGGGGSPYGLSIAGIY
jgi:membrane-associated phospholipid phosphatase